MMRAFVVRPFGVKNGIDFDRVHRELLTPVLAAHGIDAETTGAFAQAGNIRADMFAQLVIADLVIADISIHNANVYYELGIRHALRDRATILIRARGDDVPFDLRTDRYLEYPADNPAMASAEFAEAVRQTVAGTRADSPVFLLVPALRPNDPETLLPAPTLFTEAVRSAQDSRDRARLWLFAEEVASLDWATRAWRVIGRAQTSIRHFAGAYITWEQVRSRRPDDDEANLALATIYQRLGDLSASSAAILRAIDLSSLSPGRRAEALALRGSNLKATWAQEWRAALPETRLKTAMCSGFLYDAFNSYRDAFYEDQNHYYSGLNALALATITLSLARALPDDWAGRFETEGETQEALKSLETTRARLEATVRIVLEAADHRARRSSEFNIWLELSKASFVLLTSPRPAYVARRYGDARRQLAASAKAATMTFPAESEARQIRLYLELGVQVENCRAALAELNMPEADPAAPRAEAPQRVVVFSGHRLDEPGRVTPRFPVSHLGPVRSAIETLLERERKSTAGSLEAFAGGASGSDIIFHEVCARMGIPSTMLLTLPPDRYLARSVQQLGDWVDRFWHLSRSRPTLVLGESEALPPWLSGIRGYNIWQRNNLWALATGLSKDRAEVTLMLVWDGQPGDGPGGTADMAKLARARGVKVLEPIAPLRLSPSDT
jgi:tetratricopeptide (TPR) repeat protein